MFLLLFLSIARASFDAKAIYEGTGVPVGSSLKKWYEWGYLTRKAAVGRRGQPVFVYGIAEKGRKFLFIIPRKVREELLASIPGIEKSEGQNETQAD